MKHNLTTKTFFRVNLKNKMLSVSVKGDVIRKDVLDQ